MKLHRTCFLVIVALAFLIGPVSSIGADVPASPFTLLDARQRGVFNMGPAQAELSLTFDEEADKNVLQLDYSIPKTTGAGVWTKDYPDELGADLADIIHIAVKAPDCDSVQQIAVTVELKGTQAVQRIALTLSVGWNSVRELIDWNAIGDLTEVVFVVSHAGGDESAIGSLSLDCQFSKRSWFQKASSSVTTRVGVVVLAGLCLALITALVGRLSGRSKSSGASDGGSYLPGVNSTLSSTLRRDFVYGFAAVLLAGMVYGMYVLGTMSFLVTGWYFLAVGLAGVVIAEWLKYGLTGKHLTPVEVFQDVLLTGVLAATSSTQLLLQAPASWANVLLISNLTALITCLIYHTANAVSLSSSGRHIRVVSGALIVGAPYILGWLLVLESPDILTTWGRFVTNDIFCNDPVKIIEIYDFTVQFNIPEVISRVLIVLGFNVIVSNGIHLIIHRKVLTSVKAYLLFLIVSLAVVFSPIIADLGSGDGVEKLKRWQRLFAVLPTTIFSQAGLWAQVYLVTGMVMNAIHGIAPSWKDAVSCSANGMKKGMVYSGTFIGILYGADVLLHIPAMQRILTTYPSVVALLAGSFAGAAAFPLLKTIIETFDGSTSFFRRVCYNYRNPWLYSRGIVIGLGLAYGITEKLYLIEMSNRILFGLGVGVLASAGVSILRDSINASRGCGRLQSWRSYFTDAVLGGFIGSALAFYLDASQVAVVAEKFELYVSVGHEARPWTFTALISKWGHIHLGSVTGGVKLFFNEALQGVITWSVAAWLFAVNWAFLTAIFQRDKAPIRALFSKNGFTHLIQHMIMVMRWGLWMSPIISSFLRQMGEPTWYNQDGAIRTIIATFQNLTMGSEDFQTWSLQVFIYVLAYDFFRIAIWLDHMGLRVATLVNLSFIGMDKLDEKFARFIGRSATAGYIPEGVKRFTTWAPLLIPFYIPQGKMWDQAWDQSQAIQNAGGSTGTLFSAIQALPISTLLLLVGAAIAICTSISFIIRWRLRRPAVRKKPVYELSNSRYEVICKENGETYSRIPHNNHDVSRRSYDTLDPCGRVLYLVDAAEEPQSQARAWPVVGNFPNDRFKASRITKHNTSIQVVNSNHGIRTTVNVELPDLDSAAEVWTVTVENLTDRERQLKVVPYLEWVLDRPENDRGHTQYSRLFPEMSYISQANAVLAWQKNSKAMGVLAADGPPEGFLSSRIDFIGRAKSIWNPRIVETLAFMPAQDTSAYPTFDPIGSLLMGVPLGPKETRTMRFLIGYTENKQQAVELIHRHLQPQTEKVESASKEKTKSPLIGHGEILPGTPQPYSEYRDNGNTLCIHTPFTPRPYDHAMSNAKGHYITVTNRGMQTSSNGNSQQNRLTPDWPDTVTREIPSEALYLYDIDEQQWYCPTYHPLNDTESRYETEFSVDGTAAFYMTRGTLSTELTVFVPPDEPIGVYLLTVKNNDDAVRRMRFAPYFQIVLADQVEHAGPLSVRHDKKLHTLFFKNPRNNVRSAPAFVSMSIPSEHVETKRGRFFGAGRGVNHPFMVETGVSDITQTDDNRTIASFLSTLEIPAHSECTVVVILGQTDSKSNSVALIQKYKNVDTAKQRLAETRTWWRSLMETVQAKTNDAEFDQLQNWLKYQALTERVWARRGFYQTSGAFGFRDQLQDTVNLIWVDPALARKQIVLNASQQFLEGDVVHWFHCTLDGRTGFANRSYASDNLLWLVWGVVEYVHMTGDDSILNETAPYLVSEVPLEPLPKGKQGFATVYLRSPKVESVYRHCLKSIDLVLEKRTGKHGLPLILTGDWNDGLDEIGSQGKGESVWLGFFFYYILNNMLAIIEAQEGHSRKEYYLAKMEHLKAALENTWRDDRYLRAIHDDGTEIGIKDSGVWEIDALTAAWAVLSGINPTRGRIVLDTALSVLERDNTVLLGWPALREDTTPYLGRSSHYPEGVRENGMYCHGVQWLIKAARIVTEQFEQQGDTDQAAKYRETTYRLWRKITPVSHVVPREIERYGGQPNKQPADLLTTFDPGRMIWNGYTGAAGWLLRQAYEGVVGANLSRNQVILPGDIDRPRGQLQVYRLDRNVKKSPLK